MYIALGKPLFLKFAYSVVSLQPKINKEITFFNQFKNAVIFIPPSKKFLEKDSLEVTAFSELGENYI